MTIQANQGFGVSVFGATSAGGGGSTSPGGSSGQVQYNNGGSFGGMSGTTWTDASQSLAIASTGAGTGVTTSSPVLNLSQTWNDGAVTFTGLKFNATDTASASGSLLLDLQVGSSSKVAVGKNGSIALNGGSLNAGEFNTPLTGGLRFGSGINGVFPAGNNVISIITNSTTSATFRETGAIFFTSMGLGTAAANLTADVILTRAAAATLQLGAADAAAPVAQTFKVQSGTAGASATTVSISGTSLTIAGTVTGTIAIGHAVTGTGVSAGTLITAGSGTSWTVNNSQTVGPITAYFNSVGANFTIQGSQGSGPSAGGSLIFQVAPAGSAATTAQNAYSTALTIASDRTATFAGSVTIGTFVNLSQSNNNLLFSLNSTQSVYITNAETRINGGHSFGFTDGVATSSLDTILRRDGAPNTLALRNGGTSGSPVPQTFRVYNWGDATNGEYAEFNWFSNVCYFQATKAGTGTFRSLDIRATTLNFSSGSSLTQRWQIDANGHFLAAADNTYDIGASGTTNRVRTFYSGGGYSAAAPTIKTANYSQGIHDYSLIFNGSGSITLTLLAAATYPGKILYVKTIAAQTVVSASSNVKPIDTDTAGTAILAATAGKWAMLQSDGTNWVIMAQG